MCLSLNSEVIEVHKLLVYCIVYYFLCCFPDTSSRLSVMNSSRESLMKKSRVITLFCQCGRGRLLGR